MINSKVRIDFLSRNAGLIPKGTQEKVKNVKLLIIGCGLGSQIAILAARTGFENFILCDGDNVELNNLNRQAFDMNDIGRNKAEATKKKILSINSKANVYVIPEYIRGKKTVNDLISSSDIVINMADPGTTVYEITDESQRQNKPVFFPLNFAFGAYVLIFQPGGVSLREITGETIKNDFFIKLVLNTIRFYPKLRKNTYFSKLQSLYMRSLKRQLPIPQCGISTNITSSIVIKEIIKWLEHSSQVFAPHPIIISPFYN